MLPNTGCCVLKRHRLLAGESPVLVRVRPPGSRGPTGASLNLSYFQAVILLWRQPDQRSRRKSYNRPGFNQMLEQFGIEKPRIVNRPKTRMARNVA
jgi:hypothetical protein